MSSARDRRTVLYTFGSLVSRSTSSDAAVKLLGHDGPIMRGKRFSPKNDVHQMRLQAVFEVAHLALEACCREAFSVVRSMVNSPACLPEDRRGFERFGIVMTSLCILMTGLIDPLDFLKHGVGLRRLSTRPWGRAAT